MKVGTSLFKKGSRSMKSQSRIRILPNFLNGASMIELTSRDCQSSSKKVLSFTVNTRSVIYLLIAHFENKDTAKRDCPEWLQERFFLRDEHVHLMKPIGSSEGIQIWEKEEAIEQGGTVTIPGLSGYGDLMVIAVTRASSRRRPHRRRDTVKEEEVYDELIELDDGDLITFDDMETEKSSMSPGQALMRRALG